MSSNYTIQEAAEKLKVHPATVRREIKRGNLDCRRIGLRVIRITDSDLENYITKCLNKPLP